MDITYTVFQQLGFTPNEGKIYEALLALKEGTVTEIAQKTSIHRRNVYDALNRMVDKGIAFQNFEGKEAVYVPVDPDKLLDMAKEREINLLTVLPQLKSLYGKGAVPQGAYIYKGVEGFKNYVRDYVRTGENVYMFGGHAWVDERTRALLIKTVRELERKKKSFKIVFDSTVHESLTEISLKNFEKIHVAFPKQYNAISSVDVFGPYVGAYTVADFHHFDEEALIFIVKNQSLADSVHAWWQFAWDMLGKKA